MTTAEQLMALMEDDDPFGYGDDDVGDLLIRAANERLEQRRDQIRVLDRRAADEGVEGLSSPADLGPLLFAHTTYKSYPESFVERGEWDRLLLWLETLSTRTLTDVDTTGVEDVDGLVERLRAHGHHVFSTSGTSGKCSFLNQTAVDLDVTRTTIVNAFRWSTGFAPEPRHPVVILGPHRAPTRYGYMFDAIIDAYGRPGGAHYLFDEPLRMSDLNRMGALRRAIADGTATPSEIEAAQRAASEREATMAARLASIADVVLEHRDEPTILYGLSAQLFAIMEAAKAKGAGDAKFHPETSLFTGGGLKGVNLPDDYEQQVQHFFNLDPSRVAHVYGMQEMSSPFAKCEAGRYHRPPWVLLLVLDKPGERLLNPSEGQVEGRMAFFDVALDGRWGGLISGDRIVADFSPCPCGRKSPTVLDVVRYSDLPEGDDKLTCSGTVESYVRGVLQN